jgi:outer membrane biosynthesis protein TonB
MASKAGVFFAGVGTTFIILGAGFGGGLMMATSALKEPTGFQNRASAEPPSPVRVILPSTAEAAQPPEPSQQIATGPEPPPPMKEAQTPVEKQIEKVNTKKAEAEQRERRKRYAERKAKRQAEKAKRQQQIEQGEHQEAPIMAFGGDEPRRSGGFGLFGN